MTIEKQAFGDSPEGPVERINIENGNGVGVSAITYGAIITSVRLPDAGGAAAEVTLGFDSLAGYLGSHPYYGSSVGRVANRIAGAAFAIDGRTVRIDANQGENTLHGGAEGFHRKLWTAELFGESDEAGVVFSRRSPDGECGFPGNLDVRIRMSLSEANALTILYEATTDRTTAVSLTNHAYWNLSGRPRDTILGHVVTIDADHFLPTGEGQIPTGRITPVAGDPHDFRQPKPVGRDIEEAGGFDECYLFGDGVGQPAPRASMSADTLRRFARIEDPESGRTMEVHSTMPGLQFYTGNKLEGAPARDGGTLPIHAAMCFETQFLPNAVNEPGFPSPILLPGETYRHKTVHVFGTL